MNNVGLALNILLDLISTAEEVGTTIQQANASGKDITPEQLQQIVDKRNAVLDQLKTIAYGGK